ncbi:hypothetical protein F4802DRAFT_252926 [Xylaria palmicola]|nr:hypothetical protein F4802DRAFT_252926 [Xylaria palmicola]
MALAVKHLNSDSSFLLSFQPVIPESLVDSVEPRTFTILLDPWITGPSTILHPRVSITSHKHPACVASLTDLSQPPDVVIVSQNKPDHCNEATLRQLPAGGRTLILAEPASARAIRSWKYFGKHKIRTIERWQDPRITGKQSVIRIPVPPLQPGGREGEVTVAFIPQRHDLAGLHGAIGITYKSPPTDGLTKQVPLTQVHTPPSTPESYVQRYNDVEPRPPVVTPIGDTFLLPPTPPMSPVLPISPSLRSTHSASTLIVSPTFSLYSPKFRPATSSQNEKPLLPPSPYSHSRPISVIFSPHGIQYSSLAPYATSHLVAEAALPLTALLHCMDSISNPWWLGGNICAGVPCGAEIASTLGARLWISAHDGDKDVRGLATGLLKTRRWDDDEIQAAIEHGPGGIASAQRTGHSDSQDRRKGAQKGGTEILRLNCGEEILVSGTGRLWRAAIPDDPAQSHTNLAGQPASLPPPTAAGRTRQQGKHNKKTLATLALPSVMAPGKPGVYRALRAKDWIKPSPRLVIEREVASEAEPRRVPAQRQRPPGIRTERATTAGPAADGAVPRSDPSGDRSVRFALSGRV